MLYPIIHSILADRKGGEIFRLFTPWHFAYIALALAAITLVCIFAHKKGAAAGRKAARAFGTAAFALYVADFFLMPLAYGEIDVEKLPFHACTATCVMCFLARRVRFLRPWRVHFAMLGFVSNFVYLVYPAGVMWHSVHPLSYRVIQTLLFHALMTAACFLTLAFDESGPRFRRAWRDLAVVAGMTAWALLGNTLYCGTADGYSHDFNWFFVTADPFGIIDRSLARYVMPPLNIAIFFAAEMLVCAAFAAARRIRSNRGVK